MVAGIERFREYFKDYSEQYVLIGGSACDISFQDQDLDFRVTKDLDMVLIVEALTSAFAERFWEFIRQGGYQIRQRSNGVPQFYRFDHPTIVGYPAMIELFSRREWDTYPDSVVTPVHIDDSVSSLSAILLNDAYYELLLQGRDLVDGVSILRPTWLIPFKAKAWLDLTARREGGEHVDSRNIKKHKNDILRLAAEMVLEPCNLPDAVRADMAAFTRQIQITDTDLRNLGIRYMHQEDILRRLREIYDL